MLSRCKVLVELGRFKSVASPAFRDEFCLYFWRSLDTPGTLYLAKTIDRAEAVYTELVKEGYIVKAVHVATDAEYALYEGALLPVHSLSQR